MMHTINHNKDINFYSEIIEKLHPNLEITVRGMYVTDLAEFRCRKCGLTKVTINRGPLNKDYTFPCICNKNASFLKRHTLYENQLRQLNKNVTVLELYKGSGIPLLHRCDICRYEWKTNPWNMRLYGCPSCAWDNKKEFYGNRKLLTLQGIDFNVQGYEDHALKLLDNTINLKLLAVKVADGKPVIQYTHLDKIKRYVPDFLYKKTVIEVKSLYTLGQKDVSLFEQNKCKALATINQGYKFRLLVFNSKGIKIKIPKHWYNLTLRDILTHTTKVLKHMNNHTAIRYHDISCGHRVHGHEGKCKNLHGHGYRITFFCTSDSGLDSVGRVIDSSEINTLLCMWVEDNWDHKMLLWCDDPIIESVRAIDSTTVALPFNPTAENLAEYLVNIVGPAQLTHTGIKLVRVDLEETRKCSVTYSK